MFRDILVLLIFCLIYRLIEMLQDKASVRDKG